MTTATKDRACKEVGKSLSRPSSLTPTSWTAPASLSLQKWMAQGRRLGFASRASQWWVGDWVNYGEIAYGAKYGLAAKISSYDIQTLMNMSYVASKFEISRRRETLSWSHHAELAALSQVEQEKWLDLALEKSLSVHKLRDQLNITGARKEGAALVNKTDLTKAPGELTCPHCGHKFVRRKS